MPESEDTQTYRIKFRKNRYSRREIPINTFRYYQILTLSNSYRYYVIMIDCYTKWPEVTPEKFQQKFAKAFYTMWISKFGTSKIITTDQEVQFEVGLFKALTNLLGCKRIRTSPYHSSSNGILERWYRTLKTPLRCHLQVTAIGTYNCLQYYQDCKLHIKKITNAQLQNQYII